MSHEFESGFVVRERAWHGLATVLQNAPTSAEAIKQAGLDWEVVPSPVYVPECVPDGSGFIPGLVAEGMAPAPNIQAMVRSSDSSVLGIVSDSYVPVQNREAFDFFDPFIADGSCAYESAGSLKGGKRVWVLAKIAGEQREVSEGDVILPYLLLSTAHDGSQKVIVTFTPIRVVCWNTLSAAEEIAEDGKKRKKGAMLKVMHRSNVTSALSAVRDVIDLSVRSFNVTIEQFKMMREKELGVEGLRDFVRDVYNERKKDLAAMIAAAELAANEATSADARAAHREKANEMRMKMLKEPQPTDDIESLFETGPGADLAGKTVWGAYNALTHYLDHERGKSQETRLYATWFGTGKTMRENAHKHALARL